MGQNEEITQKNNHQRQHWEIEFQFENCDKGNHDYIGGSNKCQICGKQKIDNSELY